MPRLDNFSLSNFGLGGSAPIANPKSLLFTNINGGLSVPAQSTNLIVWSGVTFEAGTKLISIHPNPSSFAQLTAASGGVAYCRFGLVDSAGLIWALNTAGSANSTCNIANITINVQSGFSFTVQATLGTGNMNGSNTASWGPITYSRLSDFKADGPLTFALLGTNSTASSSNVSIVVNNFQADWI
ncbi:hypothetical protein [Paenibacillus pabuli]|uniref:hypothetical protein n=1 Tax=Paenibacillus pabuli TaxID=1472 RepID=UPI00200007D0|nr:hypothetical protein [Paenibacillus pabuli]UPK45209.1 hypothetical protein KET34_06860 [Paenibacillus pabuli]